MPLLETAMADELELTIRNELRQVGYVAALAAERLGRWNVEPATAYRVQLVLEEVLSNVIRHGFADEGEHEIEVRIGYDGRDVEVRVSDDGASFDPAAAPEVDVDGALDDRPVGGLGIHLVKSVAKQIEHRRAEGRNELRVLV